MSFPIVPLPQFLLDMYPFLIETHEAIMYFGGILFAFYGFFILLLWVPNAVNMGQVAKDRIRLGYFFLAIALGFVIFGLYLFAILIILSVITLILVFLGGFLIAFRKNI